MKKNLLIIKYKFLCILSWFALAVVLPFTIIGGVVTEEGFSVGINYPWIAYGHDMGANAWGHDGLTNNGWTFQTWWDSQGIIDTYLKEEATLMGVSSSLCIVADLVGQHPNKSRGEVYIDLRNHRPNKKTVCGFVEIPINLTGTTIHISIWLPKGSAGRSNAPNGIQIFCKSEGWYSWYSQWQNIQQDWEEKWIYISVNLSEPPSYRDLKFDPQKIIAVGLKVSINDLSDSTLKGNIYLKNYVIESVPPITFNFEQMEMQQDFTALKNVFKKCPKRVIRVFIFADGRAAPEFDPITGEVTGFDKYFFRDLDALLTVAKQHDLLLILTLLDYTWCNKPTKIGGVQLGGHSDIIRDEWKRQSFLKHVLEPLMLKYSDNSQIFAWDIINEPEWRMKGVPETEDPEGEPVSVTEMQEFVRSCAEIIHAHTSQKVTVGSASLTWLVKFWKGVGLDLYQFHWYDPFVDPCPWPYYGELGLDKPCIIGEVPTANTLYSSIEFLKVAWERGYYGILFWSYRAFDRFSNFCHAQLYLKAWCEHTLCH